MKPADISAGFILVRAFVRLAFSKSSNRGILAQGVEARVYFDPQDKPLAICDEGINLRDRLRSTVPNKKGPDPPLGQ